MPSRDRGDAGFERESGSFLDGARQCAAMKDAELVDVLSSRLGRMLDGITVGNQRVTTMVGERA